MGEKEEQGFVLNKGTMKRQGFLTAEPEAGVQPAGHGQPPAKKQTV